MTPLKSISFSVYVHVSRIARSTAYPTERNGVVILFVLLKLCSATNVDTGYVKSVTGYVKSVSLDSYINSRVNFWVGNVQRSYQGLRNATFNQQPPLTLPSHFSFEFIKEHMHVLAIAVIHVFHTLLKGQSRGDFSIFFVTIGLIYIKVPCSYIELFLDHQGDY